MDAVNYPYAVVGLVNIYSSWVEIMRAAANGLKSGFSGFRGLDGLLYGGGKKRSMAYLC